jgi:SSS family solute:Na+ symporter
MNVFNSLSLGANQMMIQRVLATDGKRRMMTALFVNQLISTIVMIFIAMVAWGLVAFCSVNSAAASRIEHTDKLVAWYIVHYVPAGAKGLILAGLLGAMMSTFDSVLNSLSTVTLNDFYERYLFKRRSDHHYVNAAKIFTVVWGLIILLFSLWQAQRSDKTVIERLGRVNVLLASPVFCFFILGLFSKRVNTAGALIGGFMGIVSAVVISGFPGIIEKPFDINVNWMWVGAFATAISFVSGYFSSFLFAKPKASNLTGLTIYGITESSD